MEYNKNKTCSFFGHSVIEETEELIKSLTNKIENMIAKENYNIFYFGGFGRLMNFVGRLYLY